MGTNSGSQYDWIGCKSSYVEGLVNEDGSLYFPTHGEVSEMYGMSVSSIEARASAEDWKLARDMFIDNLERRKREKRVEMLASQASAFDLRVLKACKAALSHLEAHFAQAALRFQAERVPAGLEQLDRASRTLERLQRVGRLSLGESQLNIHNDTDSWLDVLETAAGNETHT